MSYRALCQDCLRAPTFATEAEQQAAHCEDVMCQCGGQLCACEGCLDTLAALEEWRFSGAGLTKPIATWTAHGGAA